MRITAENAVVEMDGTIAIVKPLSEHARCKHCGHAAYAHTQIMDAAGNPSNMAHGDGDCIACGCTHFEVKAKDPLAGREWIVQVEFYLKNKWVKGEARVRAMGQVGAIAKGLREVKKDVVKPRARVAQIRITLIPISKKKVEVAAPVATTRTRRTLQ